MITVFKYPLDTDKQVQMVELNEGCRVLTCQLQDGVIMLWCLVDTKRKRFKTPIYIFGTGEPIQHHLDFIATVQLEDKTVWHVFREVQ